MGPIEKSPTAFLTVLWVILAILFIAIIILVVRALLKYIKSSYSVLLVREHIFIRCKITC